MTLYETVRREIGSHNCVSNLIHYLTSRSRGYTAADQLDENMARWYNWTCKAMEQGVQ